jgi:UDP-N-acetylmuramate--alanine ligase
MPGVHNVLNALAATAVGLELDVPMEMVRKGLADLGGLQRRFQFKGEARRVLIMDDYGHHPSEIVATLRTAKECYPDRRLIVVFQPHRYTRTHDLYERFMTSFNEADVLLLAPIYSAGEPPMEGVSAERLAQGIKGHGHKDVSVCRSRQEALATLLGRVRPGDLVLTLGAGDVYQIGEGLIEALEGD